MNTVFVDSNVFLRFFTRDDEGQYKHAARLFRDAAAGKLELVTGPPVLFEIAWTLRAAYRQPREKVLDVLSAILTLPGLRLRDAALIDAALATARKTGQEFADSYIVKSAHEAGANSIAIFNRSHFVTFGAALYWP